VFLGRFANFRARLKYVGVRTENERDSNQKNQLKIKTVSINAMARSESNGGPPASCISSDNVWQEEQARRVRYRPIFPITGHWVGRGGGGRIAGIKF
jgi:hypothetical protein